MARVRIYSALIEHPEGGYYGPGGIYESIWPEVYNSGGKTDQESSVQYLLKLKEEKGSIVFNTQYQNTPIDPQGYVFKLEWLKLYDRRALDVSKVEVFQGVDPTYKGTGRDNFAMVTGGVVGSHIYLLDVIKAKADLKKATDIVVQHAQLWNPMIVAVEANLSQSFLVQQLMERCSYPIKAVDSQEKKSVRFQSMAVYFESGKVLLPGIPDETGNLKLDRSFEPFLEEWLAYDPNNRANLDDVLDATDIMLQVALGTHGFASGTVDADGVDVERGTYDGIFGSRTQSIVPPLPQFLTHRNSLSSQKIIDAVDGIVDVVGAGADEDIAQNTPRMSQGGDEGRIVPHLESVGTLFNSPKEAMSQAQLLNREVGDSSMYAIRYRKDIGKWMIVVNENRRNS